MTARHPRSCVSRPGVSLSDPRATLFGRRKELLRKWESQTTRESGRGWGFCMSGLLWSLLSLEVGVPRGAPFGIRMELILCYLVSCGEYVCYGVLS